LVRDGRYVVTLARASQPDLVLAKQDVIVASPRGVGEK
jgi:hypothetical protein